MISIVIPCYNEEDVLPLTWDALNAALRDMGDLGVRWEIVLVDDGSRDATPRLLTALRSDIAEVVVVLLSRNFGHQVAVSAGLDHATGDAVVVMDADLQDPPSVIRDMVAAWRDGADVAYGVRRSRAGETGFKRATAALFYRLLNTLSEVPIPLDTGDFRLLSRRVVDHLRALPERDRFLRGLVAWVGYRQVPIAYDRAPRAAGTTKYPLARMLRFAVDGVTSFTTAPLRVAIWVGLGAAGLALCGVVWAIVVRITTDDWVPGWAALFVAVLFFAGIQLIGLGLIGEYLGRVFMQTKGRPLFITREVLRKAPVHAAMATSRFDLERRAASPDLTPFA